MGATVPLKSGVRDAEDPRMRGESRSWSVTLIGMLVVLVLGAGVVSAKPVQRRAGEEERRARAAGVQLEGLDAPVTTTRPPAAGPPATTPQATAAPVRIDPRPSATARAPARGPAGAGATTPAPGATSPVATAPASPSPPPEDGLGPWAGVDRRFQPGRTTWSASGGGWSISVRIDNPAPAVGDAVRFDFVISSTVDPCCGVSALFTGAPTYSARSGQCPAREPQQPGTARFSTSVAFDRAGWQTFSVAATTGSCGLDPPRGAFLIGDIEVKSGPPSAVQGPAKPVFVLAAGSVPGHIGDNRWFGVSGDASDPDGGGIRSLTVDWGDGSPASRPSEPLPPPCTVQPDGLWVPNWLRFDNINHLYATPGTYVATLIAVSTACDGVSMPQTSSQAFTWSTESGFVRMG